MSQQFGCGVTKSIKFFMASSTITQLCKVGPFNHMSESMLQHCVASIKFFNMIWHDTDPVQLLVSPGSLWQEKQIYSFVVFLTYAHETKLDRFDMVAGISWFLLTVTSETFSMHFHLTTTKRPDGSHNPIARSFNFAMLKICHRTILDSWQSSFHFYLIDPKPSPAQLPFFIKLDLFYFCFSLFGNFFTANHSYSFLPR